MKLDSVTLGDSCRARVPGAMTVRGQFWLDVPTVCVAGIAFWFGSGYRGNLGPAGRVVQGTHGEGIPRRKKLEQIRDVRMKKTHTRDCNGRRFERRSHLVRPIVEGARSPVLSRTNTDTQFKYNVARLTQGVSHASYQGLDASELMNNCYLY